jgi:hypothetical protein
MQLAASLPREFYMADWLAFPFRGVILKEEEEEEEEGGEETGTLSDWIRAWQARRRRTTLKLYKGVPVLVEEGQEQE